MFLSVREPGHETGHLGFTVRALLFFARTAALFLYIRPVPAAGSTAPTARLLHA
jgi:hypothetical protein